VVPALNELSGFYKTGYAAGVQDGCDLFFVRHKMYEKQILVLKQLHLPDVDIAFFFTIPPSMGYKNTCADQQKIITSGA
jgi:hypothetical protein